MAVHEFSDAPSPEIKDIMKSNTSSKILSNAKQIELSIYKFAKAHGGKKCFE